jgi:hypothetical protein
MKKLKGGNMDIDFISGSEVEWEQDECPWNVAEDVKEHKCAVKNVSICKYFRGVKKPDIVLCAYEKS